MPYADAEAKRSHNAKYYQKRKRELNDRQRSRRHENPIRRPFIGVDGEGGNIGGRHEYLLLRAGDHTLHTGKPLTTLECLEFLAGLPTNAIYVGYFFDYDVTMILRDLTHERVTRLLDRQARDQKGTGWALPLNIGNYVLDWMPHKEFRVKHKDAKKWVVISDVGPFFQSSFVAALDRWGIGSEEEREMIREGKAKRVDFEELTGDTDVYNALEIKLLQELMYKFREVLDDIDVRPAKWQGPGNVAGALLTKHHIPKNVQAPLLVDNPELVAAAQSSYYGGWFEINRVGHIDGPVWQYDINSAYPAAMLNLPCLEHSTVERVAPKDLRKEKGGLYLAHIRFEHKGEGLWGSFPWRNKQGNISHPIRGAGWYWSWEIEKKLPGTSVRVDDALVIRKNCDCQPFDWVEDLYLMRKSVGKDSKGIALKLALNSLYGKLAQSVGRPQWSNPVYASLITSFARARLLEAIGKAGDKVVMVATDAVFTTEPIDLPIGNELGEWSADEYPDIFVIQPGLYVAGGRLGSLKTRGVSKALVEDHLDQFYSEFAKVMECRTAVEARSAASVTLPVRQFMGLKLAASRNGYEDLVGQWIETPREIRFDWSTKRGDVVGVDRKAGNVTLGMLEMGGGRSETTTYKRAIGGGFLGDLTEGQPDWVFNLLGHD